MSDYGFATYDGKKLKGSINSKWPIFGPKYKDIAKCFKTIHITDTYSAPLLSANLSQPADNSDTEYRWNEKQLIAQFEHGYNFRPLGYAYFSGDLLVNVRCMIDQEEVITGSASPYGGNFTIYGNATQALPILPNMSEQMVASYISTAYSATEMSLDSFFFGIQDGEGTGGARNDIIVPTVCLDDIKKDYFVADPLYGPVYNPYVVEIDEKYVKIYRNVYWLDYWYRFYRSFDSPLFPEDSFTHLINDRVQGAVSYTGSSIDCSIYLAPYRMEDLL